ncbi:MAG: Y-family DNA polymerase, partial [Burkholderiaceae bacterium]|nr:Y-family DNA polymerase [Burkholderiaceae bacterium]
VVVLSSNDGCAVARSNEVKALGVKMGTPWFRMRDLARRHRIVGLSSNFTLYGDMSDRVVAILRDFSPDVEVYSIDESFVGIDDSGGAWGSPAVMGQAMRQRILQWTGLPVCVGIASSKTLAKLANHIAKTQPQFDGVCDFSVMASRELDRLVDPLDVREVWGIGRKSAEHLHRIGIDTVGALRRVPAVSMRSHFGVVMERIASELRGLSCLELDDVEVPRQQIITSRSFGVPVTMRGELGEAVSTFVARACERLRRQESVCGAIHVFIETSRFGEQHYANGITVPLPEPSNDTRVLNAVALSGLQRVFRAGCHYKKAGVVLMDLSHDGFGQHSLFDSSVTSARSVQVMAAMDAVNALYGRDTLHLGSAGTQSRWVARSDNRTPRYTTDWNELPTVRASQKLATGRIAV